MNKELEVIEEQALVILKTGEIDTSAIPRLLKKIKRDIFELDLENMEATEENKKKLKEVRKKLNDELSDIKNNEKQVKEEFTKPLDLLKEELQPVYEELKNASDLLKDKIDLVEDTQKEVKKNELIIYFNELKLLTNQRLRDIGQNIDFITFEDMNLNITLSATETSLKTQINDNLEKRYNDIQIIHSNEHPSRLKAKYIKYKDISKALVELQTELKIENEIIENAPKVEVKKEEVKVEDVPTVEQVFRATFTIEDTKDNIKKVRQFLIDNDINYITK